MLLTLCVGVMLHGPSPFYPYPLPFAFQRQKAKDKVDKLGASGFDLLTTRFKLRKTALRSSVPFKRHRAHGFCICIFLTFSEATLGAIIGVMPSRCRYRIIFIFTKITLGLKAVIMAKRAKGHRT
jgi:hypothetical protein